MIENIFPGTIENSIYHTSLQHQLKERAHAIPSPSAGEDKHIKDTTTLSPEAMATQRKLPGSGEKTPAAMSGQGQLNLTAEEIKQLQQLKQRDREVRTHEQAHLAVAGSYARGGASYTYEQGPDGNRYATGGEVPIDVSEEQSPEATIQKMRVIRRAALAPADPSPADRQIAANALAKEIQAKQEVATENQSELNQLLSSSLDQQQDRNVTNTAIRSAGTAGATRSMMVLAYQQISSLA